MEIQSYIEAKVVPGTGMTSGLVIARAISVLRDARIGGFAVAFPQARDGGRVPLGNSVTDRIFIRKRPTIGDTLHLFGSAGVMTQAAATLERFANYLVCNEPSRVPVSHRHACYQRFRSAESTPATGDRKLRRRLRRVEAGKTSPPTEDELMRYATPPASSADLPYLLVRSHATGQQFSAVFRMTLHDAPTPGSFDTYGFGIHGATVPYIV